MPETQGQENSWPKGEGADKTKKEEKTEYKNRKETRIKQGVNEILVLSLGGCSALEKT